MPRTATSTNDKIRNAVSAALSASEQAYFDWVVEQSELAGVTVDIDESSFKLARSLYNDFLKDPDVIAANAERKAARDAEKAAKESKAVDRAMALLAARGFVIERNGDADAE